MNSGGLPLLTICWRCRCQGSVEVELFLLFYSQKVAVSPEGNTMALGFRFPPPGMVGHVAQHMAKFYSTRRDRSPRRGECTSTVFCPRVSRATVRALVLSRGSQLRVNPDHQVGARNYGHVRHGKRPVEVGFRSWGQELAARSGGVTGWCR